MNIPNSLTLMRLIFVPVFVVLFYIPWHYSHVLVASIFILGAITDALDGYLARNLHQETKFGAFLDPVVDKLVVVIALLLIISEMNSIYITLPAIVIVGREIIVSALREWMAELGKRASVAVSMIGKIKTTIQMISVILLLLYTPRVISIWNSSYKIIGICALYIASLLTLWSMIIYIKTAWKDLTSSVEN